MPGFILIFSAFCIFALWFIVKIFDVLTGNFSKKQYTLLQKMEVDLYKNSAEKHSRETKEILAKVNILKQKNGGK